MAQCWVLFFRPAQAQWAVGAQGTRQPNFCWLVAGKAQGKTLFKKRNVFLGVLPFQALFFTRKYSRLYDLLVIVTHSNSSWHFTLQTEANTQDKKVIIHSPCSNTHSNKTLPSWRAVAHFFPWTLFLDFSGCVKSLWDSSSKTKTVSLWNVPIIWHQVLSFYICMVLCTLSFLLLWQKLHHGLLANSHWKQVECSLWLQGQLEWLLYYFKV